MKCQLSIAISAGCLALLSCGEPYEEVDDSCNGNAQCPLYWVCDRLTQGCVHEVDNRFVGTMSCEFTQSGNDPTAYLGSSDISAWMGLQNGQQQLRVTTNYAASCFYSSNGSEFRAIGWDSTGTLFNLIVVLPNPHAGVFEVTENSTPPEGYAFAVVSFTPPGGSEMSYLAYSVRGFVALDVDASPGVIPSLYVDIETIPLL